NRLPPVESRRTGRTRLEHHVPDPPAIRQLALEPETAGQIRLAGGGVEQRKHMAWIGDVVELQPQLPARIRRQRLADQPACPKRDGDRAEQALAPLRERL